MSAHGWNDRTIAGWLKSSAQGSLTLSECWRIARELSSGPLADVWTAGRAAGCETACAAAALARDRPGRGSSTPADAVAGGPPFNTYRAGRDTGGAPRLPMG